MKSPPPYQSHLGSHKALTSLIKQGQKYGCLRMTRPFTWQSHSSLEDAQILQQDLDHLHLWELDWDMEFNPSKCVVIHITRSRTPVPSQYLLHGQVLESAAGSKYLGVEISNNLSFNSHIQNITTSASRSIGFLKRYIRSKNPELREMIQNSCSSISGVFIISLEPLHQK